MKHLIKPQNLLTCLLMTLIAISTASNAQAQQKRKIIRDSETGLLRFADWMPEECTRCSGKKKTPCGTCSEGRKKLHVKCGECKGKKKANCRDCFGKGKYSDPFLVAKCFRCNGTGAYSCRLCRANGNIYHQDGRKGSKCKACKKKGFIKCWMCKGKGHMPLMQPEGATSWVTANEAQVRAMEKKFKPLNDKMIKFLGTKENPVKFHRQHHYDDLMKEMIALFPAWKADQKMVKKMQEGAAKHQEFSDGKAIQGGYLAESINRAQAHVVTHLNTIGACKQIFNENKKIKERKKRAGGGGKATKPPGSKLDK